MTHTTDGPLPHLDQAGRPTLKTVAALAGVHISTASRALSASTPAGVRVASEATVQRIREVAERVGFVRNPLAASLRSNKTGTIGVLVPRLTDLVLSSIYEGIERGAAAHDSLSLVANSHDRERERADRIAMLLSRQVDGLILGDARHTDDSILADLRRREVPFVLVSRSSADYPAVTCDDRAGGALAAQHLLSLGHREVAIVAGESFASTSRDRTRGFCEEFAAAGIPIPPHRIVECGFDVAGGHEAAAGILQREPHLTGLFAVNDFNAIGVLGAAREFGRTPGSDIAVIGYNDVSVAADLPIPLSTVRSPLGQMGEFAAEQLFTLLSGGDPESIALPPELIPRKTTMPI